MPALGVLLVVGAGVLYVTGTLPRLWHDKDIQSAAAAKAAAPLVVMTAVAHRSPADAQRALPGNCLPMLETSLFARTNGYIQERLVDIGDRVKAGQRLAMIAAPDVDDQLAQSKADLSQAEANLNLNKANAELRPDHAGAGPGGRPDRGPGPAARPGPGRVRHGAGQRKGGRGQHPGLQGDRAALRRPGLVPGDQGPL